MQHNKDRFHLFNKPETITSLAAKYQVTASVFRSWIKPIEDKLIIGHKKPFTPAELKIIIDFLGEYNVE